MNSSLPLMSVFDRLLKDLYNRNGCLRLDKNHAWGYSYQFVFFFLIPKGELMLSETRGIGADKSFNALP